MLTYCSMPSPCLIWWWPHNCFSYLKKKNVWKLPTLLTWLKSTWKTRWHNVNIVPQEFILIYIDALIDNQWSLKWLSADINWQSVRPLLTITAALIDNQCSLGWPSARHYLTISEALINNQWCIIWQSVLP